MTDNAWLVALLFFAVGVIVGVILTFSLVGALAVKISKIIEKLMGDDDDGGPGEGDPEPDMPVIPDDARELVEPRSGR